MFRRYHAKRQAGRMSWALWFRGSRSSGPGPRIGWIDNRRTWPGLAGWQTVANWGRYWIRSKRDCVSSGGNQQKVVLAKWLLGPIRVLLLEEPTRGMDVHAKAEIMELVAEQKRQGAAVILASTEPELVLAHADRIATLARGRITRIFTNERATKQDLMRLAEV